MVVKIIITLDNLENSRFIDEKKLCKKKNFNNFVLNSEKKIV